MNSKTAKLLNKNARLTQQSKRKVKRAWTNVPWDLRCELREQIKTLINKKRWELANGR